MIEIFVDIGVVELVVMACNSNRIDRLYRPKAVVLCKVYSALETSDDKSPAVFIPSTPFKGETCELVYSGW